ncbi:MAG: transposase [Acidobacteriota bacterium]
MERLTTYRRRLPHFHVRGARYSLTFRLSPRQSPPLSSKECEAMVSHIHKMGPGKVEAFVVMPDHVHLLYSTTRDEHLIKTLQSLKGSSSHTLTSRFGRRSPIWQDETYDHLIRNEPEFSTAWLYIEGNPVRKGLVSRITDYPWSSAWKGGGVAAEGGRATAETGRATAEGGRGTEENHDELVGRAPSPAAPHGHPTVGRAPSPAIPHPQSDPQPLDGLAAEGGRATAEGGRATGEGK